MRLSVLALGFAENYFDDKIAAIITAQTFVFTRSKRLLLCPAVSSGAHTDYGTVTILEAGRHRGGL